MDTPDPTPEDFKRLVAFLPLLYGSRSEPLWSWNDGTGHPDGVLHFPRPEYAPAIVAFFAEAGRPCWTDFDYLSLRPQEFLEEPDRVREADLAEIRAMLTYCVRGERFSDGFWASVIEEGKARILLERLIVIMGES